MLLSVGIGAWYNMGRRHVVTSKIKNEYFMCVLVFVNILYYHGLNNTANRRINILRAFVLRH